LSRAEIPRRDDIEGISNPYQSPAVAEALQPTNAEILRTFRSLVFRLGVCWIGLGGVFAALLLVPPPGDGPIAFIYSTMLGGLGLWGLVLLVLGVFILRINMWPIYIGSGFWCLSLVASAILFPICGVVLFVIGVPMVLMVHRTLQLANQLRAAGISLKARPNEVGGL